MKADNSCKVIVGMSGGVDSSIAALMLQRAGYTVEALFMRNWEENERQGPCHADIDRKDAVAVCGKLGITFHARSFAAAYWDQVFTNFLDEYRHGRTPNPDVLCNREIKFATFLDAAKSLGADKIATGHYARITQRGNSYQLARAADPAKDQTYFLHSLSQIQLASTFFPLGDLKKTQVRSMARAAALPTHAKKDSTGICFIGKRDFRHFLAQYIPARPGEIHTPDGRCIGTHQGVMYYTLGQRAGLGIGGLAGTNDQPWYVVGKDIASRVLVVAQGHDNHWLVSHRLRTDAPHWIAGQAPARQFHCAAKTRHRQIDQRCQVQCRDDHLDIHFERPQRAVTPGQSVVLYDGEVCLGGAVITATDAAYGDPASFI